MKSKTLSSFDHKPATHPRDLIGLDTVGLRERFLIESLFSPDRVQWTYCGEDRLLVGGACPSSGPISLSVPDALGPEPLLERREMGVANLGAPGVVTVDGTAYPLEALDVLYVGRGAGEVRLEGEGARFYLNVAPAHQEYPTRLVPTSLARKVDLGEAERCNERTISLYIAPEVTESCQLMMGITRLKPGSVWNTMPCHLHLRRMEVYLYCELPEDQRVVHLMGAPEETRHLMVANEQAVVSPPWSIHSGAGTASYSFLWSMVGENQDFGNLSLVEPRKLT